MRHNGYALSADDMGRGAINHPVTMIIGNAKVERQASHG